MADSYLVEILEVLFKKCIANVSDFLLVFSPRSGMSSTSPVTLKFLLLKWVFVQGEGVENFTVSRLFYNFVEEKVCLTDFENSYLCQEDSKFFGDLLVGSKYAMWVKVIENAKGKENTVCIPNY